MNDREPALATDERTARLLRRAGVVELDPPPHVWAGIRRALPDEGAELTATTALGAAQRKRRPRGGFPAFPRVVPLLAAAAAGVLVTVAGLSLLQDEGSGQVLASGQLTALTAAGAEGSAEVVEVDGRQRLRVELDRAPDAADGYLEVWLLRPDVSGMVTVGVLEGQEGEFPLPEGLDLSDFAVVDISREHLDGDPGHGGDSLVRGQVG